MGTQELQTLELKYKRQQRIFDIFGSSFVLWWKISYLALLRLSFSAFPSNKRSYDQKDPLFNALCFLYGLSN